MSAFIVLRDRSANWRRSKIPIKRAIEPARREEPGDPELLIWTLTPKDISEVEKDPSILRVTPVMPTRLLAPEPMDDVRTGDLEPGWGTVAVGSAQSGFSGSLAKVALLDTGIDARHPCFKGVKLTLRDFVGTGIADENGHGTHTAGTVVGRDVEGVRIGVARGASALIAAKTLTDTGAGRSDEFFKGLLWACSEQADVIGFSLAFDMRAHEEQLIAEGFPQTLAQHAAVHAYRGNLRVFETILSMMDCKTRPLILGAVGNDSLRTISPDFITGPASPAAARGVLSVGAVGPGDAGLVPTPFSNAGPVFAAPGVGIVSASPGGELRSLNGSSMAMAHAMGVAALWAEALRAENKPVNAESLATAMIGSADKAGLDPNVSVFDCGRGLVQAPV
ncbi:S8 family serine peptidase [Pacificoceanicola onchidii]|uniref:S8 family serine peptidase n=1 Tax=Pacificoceanicola onchidii TaxID=2562685 RepID=UPI0010A39C45|nr:S8 family serine peptidase [Pacificoceanicola onchidii]